MSDELQQSRMLYAAKAAKVMADILQPISSNCSVIANYDLLAS